MGLAANVERFRSALEKAARTSEFVVVVVCDVRGFSDFSTHHESPDTAMYIKRLYLQLITKYFPTAKFAKPTGDGLLLVFPYTEQSLKQVAREVVTACFACLEGFPGICKSDPMINFDTPQRVGFGISRGPACCLFSGRQILDYSGHLLNLASRLTDLARPSGILIDGRFMESVIPNHLRQHFDKKSVYIRSLSEEAPSEVFYSKKHVQFSDTSLHPINSPTWFTDKFQITRKQLSSIPGTYSLGLSKMPVQKEDIRYTIVYPHKKLQGFVNRAQFETFEFSRDSGKPTVRCAAKQLNEFLKAKGVKVDQPITIELQHVRR